MSRVGKQPIKVPSGVTVSVADGEVAVQGSKGKLQMFLPRGVAVENKGGVVEVSLISNDPQAKANYGTTRALINNMVVGVTMGWKRSLEMSGVGFTAQTKGKNLVLTAGYSHEVVLPIPESVICVTGKQTIDLESPDKNVVGTFAARIRKVQPPEPYLGKGIKYIEESVRRKAGKTGKKA